MWNGYVTLSKLYDFLLIFTLLHGTLCNYCIFLSDPGFLNFLEYSQLKCLKLYRNVNHLYLVPKVDRCGDPSIYCWFHMVPPIAPPPPKKKHFEYFANLAGGKKGNMCHVTQWSRDSLIIKLLVKISVIDMTQRLSNSTCSKSNLTNTLVCKEHLQDQLWLQKLLHI